MFIGFSGHSRNFSPILSSCKSKYRQRVLGTYQAKNARGLDDITAEIVAGRVLLMIAAPVVGVKKRVRVRRIACLSFPARSGSLISTWSKLGCRLTVPCITSFELFGFLLRRTPAQHSRSFTRSAPTLKHLALKLVSECIDPLLCGRGSRGLMLSYRMLLLALLQVVRRCRVRYHTSRVAQQNQRRKYISFVWLRLVFLPQDL